MNPEKNNQVIWIINQYAAPLKYSHFGARHFFLAKEYIKQGYKVYIISSNYNHYMYHFPEGKNQFNFEDEEGITTIWVKGFRYKNSNGLGRVLSWLLFSIKLFFLPVNKMIKPDIVVVSSVSILPVINALWFKFKFKARKFIFEIRDIWPLTFTEIGKHTKYHPLALFLGIFEKIAYRKADHIVATMPKADLHIRKIIKKNFKFSCIPQGIDLDFYANLKDLPKEFITRHIPQNRFVVCYAGTIGLSNALEPLVEAARNMQNLDPDVHFILLGDGHDKDLLVKKAAGLANLSFVPKIKNSEVQSFLKHCNVLYDSVLSSGLYQFGISRNKWMDYLYSNLPIIVSFRGYDDMLEKTGSGIIIEPENPEAIVNAILKIKALSTAELDKMKNGRDFLLNDRTYQKLASDYIQIFNA
ncbi:MAG: glycosyltransferase family 4 protein [Bacteroidales bacterium]